MFQYLPLAHVLARMVAFVAIEVGGVLAFSSGDTKKLAEEIKEFNPTHIPTVPRLLEKIHTRVVGQAAAAGGTKAAIFTRALATGEKVAKAKREGRKVSPIDKARHAVGDKLALSKVRDALGTGNPVLITRVMIFSSRRGTVGMCVGLASAMSAARFFVSPPQKASVPPVSRQTNETMRASTCASGRYWKITGGLSRSSSRSM